MMIGRFLGWVYRVIYGRLVEEPIPALKTHTPNHILPDGSSIYDWVDKDGRDYSDWLFFYDEVWATAPPFKPYRKKR